MSDLLVFTAAASFESARQVSILPKTHRAFRLHGHSFVAKVRARLPTGFAPFPGGEVTEIERRLKTCVSPLDYQLLNSVVEIPTDENIARWIKAMLDVPGLDSVGVQSTNDEGADLSDSEDAHVWRRYTFQAAHRLPNVEPGHKCGRMHGHGFEVIVHARVQASGKHLGIDYDNIDGVTLPILEKLNCACLNEIQGLENPTSELISSWIWHKLKARLPELAWVTVYETASCGAHFDGSQYRIWKDMTLDSAARLSRAPSNHASRGIHGHTYKLRLHLTAPLDQLMGWTIDFGDVKELFNPVFRALDHQPLHEIDDLGDNDVESLLRWIKRRSLAVLPALDRIDLYETRGCGAILSWGDEPPVLPI